MLIENIYEDDRDFEFDVNEGEYITLRGYGDQSIEYIFLYSDGSIRLRMGD